MIITLPKSLEIDIMNFVNLNKIEDVNNFLVICLRNGFNISKYGYSPQDNFEKENKPLKIEKYEYTEEDNIERLETKETKRKGRPKRELSTKEESSKPKEEEEEVVKPKKKITIIKN